MSEMKQKESSVTTGSANNTTPSTAPQNAKAPKVKSKKTKEGAPNSLAPSGAQVIDPAANSAKAKKRNDDPQPPVKRGGNSS